VFILMPLVAGRWPAEDSWWRFTPRNLATGYLSLFAALSCLAWSGWTLLDGGIGTRRTVLFAVLAVVSVISLVQATHGIKVVLRRRAIRSRRAGRSS
jgi:hypothetical protein